MYVHIGDNTMIRSKEVIAIIDHETAKSSEQMSVYLEMNKNRMMNTVEDAFKSIVITQSHIYYSPIASATLKKRIAESGMSLYK